MTTVVAYLSMQGTQYSAVNLISDSQVSWKDEYGNVVKYKSSQKVFSLHRSPVMFAYCGKSLFGLNVLSQLTTALDYSSDFVNAQSIEEQSQSVLSALNLAALEYSKLSDLEYTQIIHVARFGVDFFMCEYSYNPTNKNFEHNLINVEPKEYDDKKLDKVIEVWGSGKKSFDKVYREMVKMNGNFSRVYFRSLVLQLKHQEDTFSGGVPQMMVLNREGLASPVGIRYGSKTYLAGAPYLFGVPQDNIEFRDEYYGFVDLRGKPFSGSRIYSFKDWKPK
ncbi:hypothetical protein QCB44_01030 [Thiomicrorhabdus sp. zzn3]|uniref:hypothetical protein n=1 Tax=Thiomicrorhabdus sp. zzn3 TaxID=3039775 RepID=UPI0024362E67|nr:hypothetical protein [Thiomicrorhabdus sp. zzn3]MDG6777279.1 hypothetical protein [Thiomicrorhabdus sp. zzn3]